MRGTPFSRFRVLMAAIGSLISQGMPQHLAQAHLGGYKSRGKGRGTPARNFLRGAGHGYYAPHQGAQEIARRLKRMNHGLPR